MKKLNAGNLFTGMRSSTLIGGLFAILIVSVVLLFANFAYLNQQAEHDKQYIGHAGELRLLSQGIAKNAIEAAAGKGEAFALLKSERDDFQQRDDANFLKHTLAYRPDSGHVPRLEYKPVELGRYEPVERKY